MRIKPLIGTAILLAIVLSAASLTLGMFSHSSTVAPWAAIIISPALLLVWVLPYDMSHSAFATVLFICAQFLYAFALCVAWTVRRKGRKSSVAT